MDQNKFRHVVVMGVSGSGKSTVAQLLADKLGWDMQEGDDLHPQLWPDCDRRDHLPVDHTEAQGTRAGTAAALGLWPHGRTTS